ncbi:unnamed protein product [Rotaria sp. Silwood1]|nr:unnamed protein product [Rotaria sp. Silwood1]
MSFYRDEIDGLRAVAVIPVILYHAGCTSYFAGGYIGVDIFFVISGYLITSVIENEREQEIFSLVHFYERRCRRILPALYFILFVSSIFAYYWMLPDQLKEFGQTLISIVALSSNIFFWWKDDGYFTQLTELNPCVHTWSLAVEEQFYFIFPLICYFSGKKNRCLIILLIFLALISFFLAQWGGNFQSTSNHQFHMFSQHSWASFYLPIGRAWELLLGSFAAFYLRLNRSVSKIRSWGYVERAFNVLRQNKNTFSIRTSTTNKRLILIGDSFAQDFYNIIIEGKHLTNYEMRVFFIHGRCQMYIGPEDRKQFINAIDHQICTNRNDIKYALPVIRQADVIILSGKWFEWSAKRLPMTLKLLNLTKKQQIFVIGRKHFGNVNPKLYVNKSTEYRLKQYQYPSIDVIKVNSLLEKTIDKSIFVNILKMICTGYNRTCPLFTRDGKLISYDGRYLTKYDAIYVGNIIFKNKPLNKL